jgi:SAM-dependent methyltransferase
VSFDRAAENYDASRKLDRAVLDRIIDLLAREMHGRAPALEVGVGTGMIALPLAKRGIRLVGLDLSAAMMAKLVDKAGGRAPLALVRGDTTRLPFRDAAFGAAYARHVLHLIGNWRGAVGELCRVVRPGGVVLISPGRFTRDFGGELSHVIRREAGAGAADPGLDLRANPDDLDEAFATAGARGRDLPEIAFPNDESVRGYLEEVGRRSYSWTWRVPEDRLRRALDLATRWALDRYGSLDARTQELVRTSWRAYDVPD